MQHSVKSIGEMYEHLSTKRKDSKVFDAEDFFNFAKTNSKKYSIVENGDDLLVSTWHSNELIEDYKRQL
jgi:hypothetical protein